MLVSGNGLRQASAVSIWSSSSRGSCVWLSPLSCSWARRPPAVSQLQTRKVSSSTTGCPITIKRSLRYHCYPRNIRLFSSKHELLKSSKAERDGVKEERNDEAEDTTTTTRDTSIETSPVNIGQLWKDCVSVEHQSLVDISPPVVEMKGSGVGDDRKMPPRLVSWLLGCFIALLAP
jgi:hypothetical protein